MVRIPHADVLHPWNLCEIFGYKSRKNVRDSIGEDKLLHYSLLLITSKNRRVDFSEE